jgi:hypothetical protein
MNQSFINAFSTQNDAQKVADDLILQLGSISPAVVIFFTSHKNDGTLLSKILHQRFAGAEVIGCTTAGTFTEKTHSTEGTAVLALGSNVVKRCSAALARFDKGVEQGVQAAVATISKALNIDLRKADATRFVGVELLEGLKMTEEAVNEALGNSAPAISFVGGSAGDNVEFKETKVFHNGKASNNGAVLLMLETATPFIISKTCSFRPTGAKFTVTRADEANRTVYEFDGEPVLKKYARAVGVAVDKLDSSVFMTSPVGLMIDGKPWIRSPQQVLQDGGIKFYCRINEGMEIELMQATDLIVNLQTALQDAQQELGGPIRGGLVFNCILRRLELDAKNLHAAYLTCYSGMTIAGFHTYGESWLGHMNQTSTALLFK